MTIELIVRVNAEIPDGTDIEHLSLSIRDPQLNIAVVDLGSVKLTNIASRINEYETLDVYDTDKIAERNIL